MTLGDVQHHRGRVAGADFDDPLRLVVHQHRRERGRVAGPEAVVVPLVARRAAAVVVEMQGARQRPERLDHRQLAGDVEVDADERLGPLRELPSPSASRPRATESASSSARAARRPATGCRRACRTPRDISSAKNSLADERPWTTSRRSAPSDATLEVEGEPFGLGGPVEEALEARSDELLVRHDCGATTTMRGGAEDGEVVHLVRGDPRAALVRVEDHVHLSCPPTSTGRSRSMDPAAIGGDAVRVDAAGARDPCSPRRTRRAMLK